jgi:hypothetical protein
MVLKFILKKWDGRTCTGLIWLRIGIIGRICERVNDTGFMDV